MKQGLILILSLLIASTAIGQVNFFEGSWDEAFAKAKTEGKHVFVDSYTDWCYWCKVMDKNTFTDEAIANYLNEEFVPIKVNMEKGFGIDVAMKFRVRGFPTLMYFNHEGELVEKKAGYEQDNGKFLDHLKMIRTEKTEKVFAFDSQSFDLEYPEFIQGVFGVGGERKRTNAETVDAWLDDQDDLYNEVAWTALTQCPTSDKYKMHVLENKDTYTSLYGTSEFDRVVISVVSNKVKDAANEKSTEMFDESIAMLNEYMAAGDDRDDMVNSFEYSFFQSAGMWKEYTMKADADLKDKPIDEQFDFANRVGWTLYEQCEDQKCLKIMEEWMAKVVELDPKYMYMDTYAALLFKTGDLANAKKYASKAIEIGKKEDTDTADTAALLEKIEASMDEDGQ